MHSTELLRTTYLVSPAYERPRASEKDGRALITMNVAFDQADKLPEALCHGLFPDGDDRFSFVGRNGVHGRLRYCEAVVAEATDDSGEKYHRVVRIDSMPAQPDLPVEIRELFERYEYGIRGLGDDVVCTVVDQLVPHQ